MKSVVAYRSVGVDVAEGVINDVRAGKITDILVTSGSVAEQISIQIGDIPTKTLVSAIGPRTAKDAEAFGLRVDAVAEEINIESMVDLLVERALSVKP